MKVIQPTLILLVASAFVGSASAQSNANAQRCHTLGQEVQAEFQKSVQARVPKTDPTSFNQDGYDIKGIMSQDVTSGLGKLMSLDFSGIINSVVNKGLEKATQRATANFSQRMNGVLNNMGVSSVNFQASTSGVNVSTPTFNNVATGVANTVVNNVKTSASKAAVGPYGRP